MHQTGARGPDGAQLAGAQRAGAQLAGAELAGAELAAAERTGARLAGVPQDAELRLLRGMFEQAPVGLLVLERTGTIRRANRRAEQLLGTRSRGVAGRLLSTFVDRQARAAVADQLATAARTGRRQRLRCEMIGAQGPFRGIVTVSALDAEGQQLLLVAVGRVDGEAARAVQAMTQRLDLVTAATRLLLDNATFSEAVTLRRCARLLADELAAWVIVDVERRQRLGRQVVIGPGGDESSALTRRVAAVQPVAGSLPGRVHRGGSGALVARAQDVTDLGTCADGVPLVTLLGATSLLCVPLSDGERTYGVLTLARGEGERPFRADDLELAEELGCQLGLAIRVDRMLRRRSEIADSLQASLLPAALPVLPGIEFATAYVAATCADGVEVGGDFYDVYRSPQGWGIAIGDVCGKGEEAAAVTAAARHTIRVLGRWNPDPADVLSRANEVLLTDDFESRFVTACAGYMQWRGDRLHLRLASAGHPAQLVIRADGEVQPLRGGGMTLGIFPDAEMDAEDVELGRGDMLFMFTDGVTEARSPAMQYFEDGLAAELAGVAGRTPAEVVSAMRSRVLEFTENELRDDVTMLVLRVGTRPAGHGGPGAHQLAASSC